MVDFGRRASGAACVLPRAAMMVLFALVLITGVTAEAQARYASIVVDAQTGKVLHERYADKRLYPASLTKMMTLYMAFEALDEGRLSFNQRLPVSKRAEGMPPSKLYLQAGQTITVREVIMALVTRSANDAAVVLAEALGGTEFRFALKMTERAHELGMSRTQFRNASGLPNNHQISTARDMSRLGRALLRDFPHYYHYFSTESFTYNGTTHGNHNNLLSSYEGTDGIKTGYIRASGFNLTASVVRDGRRLIAVVFGGRSVKTRDSHMMDLLDRGFAQLRSMKDIQLVGPPPNKPQLGNPASEPAGVQQASAARDSLPIEATPTEVGSASEATPFPPSATRPDAVKAAAREWLRESGGHAVQVGAFRRMDQAQRAAFKAQDRVPQLLSNARVSVTRTKSDGRHMYRARLVGLSPQRAQQSCGLLSSMGNDCLVIQSHSGFEMALNN